MTTLGFTKFYDYLLSYSDRSLGKISGYLSANTGYSGATAGSDKEKICHDITSYLNECKNTGKRKMIDAFNSAHIRSEFVSNMVCAYDAARSTDTDTETTKNKIGGTSFMNKIFEKIMPSFLTSGEVALTFNGKIAVKRSDGDYVVYDGATNTIQNQNDFVLKSEKLSKLFFLMPTKVADLAKGDVIVKGKYFYGVKGITDGKLNVVSLNALDERELASETNILLGERMYKKVVSLFNGGNMFSTAAGSNGGFNPMLLLLADKDGFGADNDMLKLIMISQMSGNGGTGMSNMLPLLLLNKGGDSDDMITMIAMSGMFNGGSNPFASLFGGTHADSAPSDCGSADSVE